jgi:hypothetical protein
MSRYPQVSAGLLSIPPREFIASASCSAKFTYRNRMWALLGPFFVLVSKGFSLGGRPTETDNGLKISL